MQNAPATPPPTANPIRMPVPPEEKFWKRYSPHHEAPLSGVSSVATHVVLILMILMIGFVASKLKDEDENRSLPVDVARVQLSGGGGSPGGVGNRPGGPDAPREEENPGTAEKPSDQKPPSEEPPKLSVAKQEGIKNEFNNDPHITRILKEGAPRTAQALFELDRDVREKLRRNVNPGVGQGGSGQGGGKDTGKDRGSGAGDRGGSGRLNQREKRQLRQDLTFRTRDGFDYLNQIHGLGGYVAIPHNNRQFLVFPNLKNLRETKVEDIEKFNDMYRIDNEPKSVAGVSVALGLSQVPPYFVAFFPEKLEAKLLDRELVYLRQHYGEKDENLILKSKFDVIQSGSGYDFVLREMILNR